MEIFDGIAPDYDQWYLTKKGSFIDELETDLAFKLIKLEKGMNVLDVGCGTGDFSMKLAEMGYKVTGIDISEKMLKIAKEKAKKQGYDIDFQVMDIYNLNFQDDQFDAVFSMVAFEFIKEPLVALDELFRVVKKGGQVLVGTISRDSAWGKYYLVKSEKKDSVFKHAHFHTLEEMKSLKPDQMINSGECLFIPPNALEDDFNMQKEEEFSSGGRGGYFSVVWKK